MTCFRRRYSCTGATTLCCQRLGDRHVRRSSHVENRREWAARRHTIGSPLRDGRGARGRIGAVRQALRDGGDATLVTAVTAAGMLDDLAQLPLWPESRRSQARRPRCGC